MSVDREVFQRLCPYPPQSTQKLPSRATNVPKEKMNYLIYVMMCFFVGRASFFGGLVPFGPALAVALVSRSIMTSFICVGAVFAGIVTSVGLSQAVPYAVVMGLLLIVFVRYRDLWSPLKYAAILASSLLLVRGLVTWASRGTWYDLGLVAFEALLAAISTTIFGHALPWATASEPGIVFSNEELISLGILVSVALVGMVDMPGGPLSPGNVLGRYFGVLLAYTGGGMVGTAAGVLVATVSLVAGSGNAEGISILGFAGLLAGLLREAGKAGAAGGYALGELVLSMYLLSGQFAFKQLLSLIAALVLFALTPRSFVNKIAGWVPGTREQQDLQEDYESRLRSVASGRLSELGAVMRELATSFQEVATTVKTNEENRLNNLLGALAAKVCENCNLYSSCWETGFFKTYQNTFELLSLAESHGGLLKADIPRSIRRQCQRLPELLTAINHLFDTYRLNTEWKRRLDEEREVVAAQLSGMAEVMDNLSTELKIDVRNLGQTSTAIKEELARHQLSAKVVEAWRGYGGQLEIVVKDLSCPGGRECINLLATFVKQIVGHPVRVTIESCRLRHDEEGCVLKVLPAPSYRFVAAGYSCPKVEGDVSGDTFSALELPDGRQALILSDGMGTGSKAALESQTAVRLVERLLAVGLGKDVVLRTLNAVLALRSGEECFATLDLVLLSPYTADAEFIKVGSCPTLLRRGHTVTVINSGSPPLGILPSVYPAPVVVRKNMRAGDMLIMISDGVLEVRSERSVGIDWLINYLKHSSEDPEHLALSVLDLARQRSGEAADDMTVLAVSVEPI